MALITITCPRCGYLKDTDLAAVPPGTVYATCPHCRRRFSLAAASIRPGEARLHSVGTGPSLHSPAEPPRIEQQTATPRLLAFTFTGNASEYFGIWIVNILLKILTVGIYSAWAKVRKRRYLYGNTFLDASPFDYLADPLALFKGWLIGAGLFILYMAGSKTSPSLNVAFVIIFFAVTPWLVVRSRMFNQRNTEHRGVRFRFRQNYREAYLAYAGLPLLIPFTLGLLFPYMVYRQKKFLVENSHYGETPCTFAAKPEDFYALFLKAFGCFILIIGATFTALLALTICLQGGISPLLQGAGTGNPAPLRKSLAIAFAVLFFLILAGYLAFLVYLETALANLVWNSTAIGNNRLVSTLRVRSVIWIRLTNALAVLLSVGLLIPWATIRLTRYRIGQLQLLAADDLGRFRASPREEIGPAGEEIGDIFGIDVAL